MNKIQELDAKAGAWVRRHCGRTLFYIVKIGGFVMVTNFLVLVFSTAPDWHRYLYSRLPVGYFADVSPPLILTACIGLSYGACMWFRDLPYARFAQMYRDDHPTPFEDTEMPT